MKAIAQATDETRVIAGVDVGKAKLDASVSAGAVRTYDNDPEGRSRLLAWLRERGVTQVVCEPTGGYEAPLVLALHSARMPVHLAHAVYVRNFARAIGSGAKTDRIDAQALARYGETLELAATPPEDPATRRLRSIIDRRRQLVDQRTQEYNRRDKGATRDARESAERHIRWLSGEIERMEKRCRELLDKSEALSARVELYSSVPGVGELTARTLAAHLPELGTYSGKQLSALVGVAPWARDSGRKQGYRAIRGGRETVRTALYMAAMSAIRYNPDLKRFNDGLRARGKQGKVAITAVMRKLLQLLSAIARRGTPWQQSRPEAA